MNYEQFNSEWSKVIKNPKSEIPKREQIQLVWGAYFKNQLIENGFDLNKIFITGKPNFQIIKNDYIGNKLKYKKLLAEKYTMDLDYRWVLITLTDSLAYISKNRIESYIADGANKELLSEQVLSVRKDIELLTDYLATILSDPKVKSYVIIRPHPFVPAEYYVKLMNRKVHGIPNNLKIINKESAFDWMISADVMITNYSTLSMEAKLFELPVFFFNYYNKQANNYWWVKKEQSFTDYETLRMIFINEQKLPVLNSDNIDIYINDRLDGIEETSKIISLELSKYSFSLPEVMHSFNLLKSTKRIIGSLIRLILLKINNPFRIISKGISDDYFTIKTFKNK